MNAWIVKPETATIVKKNTKREEKLRDLKIGEWKCATDW
jgi:hypothetical protein